MDNKDGQPEERNVLTDLGEGGPPCWPMDSSLSWLDALLPPPEHAGVATQLAQYVEAFLSLTCTVLDLTGKRHTRRHVVSKFPQSKEFGNHMWVQS